MKSVLFITLLLSNYAFAQYPRRANVAVIETHSVKGSSFFRECVRILSEEGYTFSRVDEVPHALITDPVEIHELPLLFRIEIEVSGAYARLHGYILDNRDFKNLGFYPKQKKWVDACYRSLRGSTWRLGFEEVVVITEKLRSEVAGKVHWLSEDRTLFDKEKSTLN